MEIKSKIVGILNRTTDSFSDGGKYLDLDLAFSKVDSLSGGGADILELSAQSSNINAVQISELEEWERIDPILKYCKTKGYVVSVDSTKPFVIQKCIEQKVDYLNSINSFRDIESREILRKNAKNSPELILMFSHNNENIAVKESNLGKKNVLGEITRFFENKFEEFAKIGISTNKIIVDPGMGFFLSPDPMVSIEVLRNINSIVKRFERVMVSVSRKSFIGALCDSTLPSERYGGTLACELYLIDQGVEFIRTHDPLQIKQFYKIQSYLK